MKARSRTQEIHSFPTSKNVASIRLHLFEGGRALNGESGQTITNQTTGAHQRRRILTSLGPDGRHKAHSNPASRRRSSIAQRASGLQQHQPENESCVDIEVQRSVRFGPTFDEVPCKRGPWFVAEGCRRGAPLAAAHPLASGFERYAHHSNPLPHVPTSHCT